jgi:penicillin-binding protein 1A
MMTRLLAKVIEAGTLASGSGYGAKLNVKDDKGVTYRIPAGGKTGTTQNWSDAWAIGFTPYYTIAIWFGFDRGGNSLGTNVSGASLAGPIWGNLMNDYNQGLPRRDFVRPAGITEATVCRASGLMMNKECPAGISLTFLEGTVPTDFCDQHGPNTGRPTIFDPNVLDSYTSGLKLPELPEGFLPLNSTPLPRSKKTNESEEIEEPGYNPLWD